MTVPAETARKLCTAAEFRLFQTASRAGLKVLNVKALKPLMGHARLLRNKWRKEIKRQAIADKKAQAELVARQIRANRKIELKEALFAETLKRFERRLSRLTTPRIVVSHGTTSLSGLPKWLRHKVKAAGKAVQAAVNHQNWKPADVSRPRIVPHVETPRDVAASIALTGAQRVIGYSASRSRRSQARRDNRQG